MDGWEPLMSGWEPKSSPLFCGTRVSGYAGTHIILYVQLHPKMKAKTVNNVKT